MTDGFRRYRVARKTPESDVITSFALVPVDGSPVPAFVPGQFLTFNLDDGSGSGPLLRHYSLSGDPARRDAYRISVKREGPPSARRDLPPGRASAFLHDRVAEGDELAARGPEGAFVLDRDSRRPVVLLSGGVGLTPLLAMAHELARAGDRPTWFIHACEERAVQAHGGEIRALAASCAGLRVHVRYRRVGATDIAGVHHDGEGFIDRAVLQALLPLDDYDVYLCGPAGFMQALYGILLDLGVREDRIRYEFFGPATVLKRAVERAQEPPAFAPVSAGQPAVTFSMSGKTSPWTGEQQTLLDFAEAQGLSPAFSCRAGICNTCQCTLVAGEVNYIVEPLDRPPPGTVLLCCAAPAGNVTVAI
jgi:ferredoxin-NADP reductase